jgi:hypothetical protein
MPCDIEICIDASSYDGPMPVTAICTLRLVLPTIRTIEHTQCGISEKSAGESVQKSIRGRYCHLVGNLSDSNHLTVVFCYMLQSSNAW